MTRFRWRSAISIAAVAGFAACCWRPAAAQAPTPQGEAQTTALTSQSAKTQSTMGIANNDGVFVDAKTFKIISGKTTTDTVKLIDDLGAKELGPGSLIFRAGDKLYMVGTPLAIDNNPEDEPRSNRIRIEYVPPTNPKHQHLYEMVAHDRRPLETVQQLFSPLRLPVDLSIKAVGCDGASNAWYERQGRNPTVKICYEYMQEIMDMMPKMTTETGIEPDDAVIGQFFYAVSHELGHALFDIFDVPVFGREEDAADQFAAYTMLQFNPERARRLMRGAAYAYVAFIEAGKKKATVEVPLKDFSSNHGTPEERFYNLLCIAYGSDRMRFAYLVEKEFLPETRAKNCKYEYQVLAYAVHHEISPHVDQRLKEAVFATTWFASPTKPDSK